MPINSKQMLHDSHESTLATDWLDFFSSMARTKKIPRMGEGRKALQVRTRAEVHSEQEPPALADSPVPEVETHPTQSELETRIEEAEKVAEVGRSPETLPT